MSTTAKLGKLVLTHKMAEDLLQQVPNTPIPVRGFGGSSSPHGLVGFVKEVTNTKAFGLHVKKTVKLFEIGKVEIIKSHLSNAQLEVLKQHFTEQIKKTKEFGGDPISLTAQTQELSRLAEEAQASLPIPLPALASPTVANPTASKSLELLQRLMVCSDNLKKQQADYKVQLAAFEASHQEKIRDLQETIELIKLELNDTNLKEIGVSISFTDDTPMLPHEPTTDITPKTTAAALWGSKQMLAHLKEKGFMLETKKKTETFYSIVRALPHISFERDEILKCAEHFNHHFTRADLSNAISIATHSMNLIKPVSRGVYEKIL